MSIYCIPLHIIVDCSFVKLVINRTFARAFTWSLVVAKWIILRRLIGSLSPPKKCRYNIQWTLFFFHFLYHVKHRQFVTRRSPDSLIQWSDISTNFGKRLLGEIGNLVGHDWWPTVISTTEEKGNLSKSQEIHTKLKTHCAALFVEHFFRRAPPKLKKYLLQRHNRKRSDDYFTNGLFLSHGG